MGVYDPTYYARKDELTSAWLKLDSSSPPLIDAVRRLHQFRLSWDESEVIDQVSGLRAADLDVIIGAVIAGGIDMNQHSR